MNRVLLILLLFLALSCRRIPQHTLSAAVKDSTIIRQDTLWRDTTILLPGDTVHTVVAVPCPDSAKASGTIRSGRTTLAYSLSGGRLLINCKTDSLITRIRWLEFLQRQWQWRESLQVKTVPGPEVKVPYIPGWFWGLSGLSILCLLYTFRRPFLNLFAHTANKW